MTNDKSNLVFICGFPSGGTDLTKTILNAHPDIFINGEMPFLVNLVKHGYDGSITFNNIAALQKLQQIMKSMDPWGNFKNVDYDFNPDLQTKQELTFEEVMKICFAAKERQVWGNKTPQNTENIHLLVKLFPKAKFLIITRDIRDVCLSWHNKWGRDMIDCAAKWAQRMEKGWQITQNLPSDQYVFIKFEDLLTDTESIMKQICQFLDIPFSDRLLEHHKYTRQGLDGKINYGNPVKADNTRKWEKHLPPKTIKRIEEITFNTMHRFNYKPKLASKQRSITLWEKGWGKAYDLWSVIFVGNRASKKEKPLKRVINYIKAGLKKQR